MAQQLPRTHNHADSRSLEIRAPFASCRVPLLPGATKEYERFKTIVCDLREAQLLKVNSQQRCVSEQQVGSCWVPTCEACGCKGVLCEQEKCFRLRWLYSATLLLCWGPGMIKAVTWMANVYVTMCVLGMSQRSKTNDRYKERLYHVVILSIPVSPTKQPGRCI